MRRRVARASMRWLHNPHGGEGAAICIMGALSSAAMPSSATDVSVAEGLAFRGAAKYASQAGAERIDSKATWVSDRGVAGVAWAGATSETLAGLEGTKAFTISSHSALTALSSVFESAPPLKLAGVAVMAGVTEITVTAVAGRVADGIWVATEAGSV